MKLHFTSHFTYSSGVSDLLVEVLTCNLVRDQQRRARLRLFFNGPAPPTGLPGPLLVCRFRLFLIVTCHPPVLSRREGEKNETASFENWPWRDITVAIGLGDSAHARALIWRGVGGRRARRSMGDRYAPDNLTSAFNSTCPHLCFVS